MWRVAVTDFHTVSYPLSHMTIPMAIDIQLTEM
jgi:hypothetical protein